MEFVGQTGVWIADGGPPREGGQATVYAAHQGGRRAAVKVARQAGAWMGRERDALRHLQEAGVATSTWLVGLYDHGQTEDGREFLVLEWYPSNLADWVDTGPSLPTLLRALVSAAEAVANLHAAGGLRDQYLHLDVKPWNFLVDTGVEPVRVVLADLGGVKHGRLHATTQFGGEHSPGFAPLEQELSLARAPDASVDVHGLAATVYACLCGRLPDARGASGGLTPAGRRLDLLQRTPGRDEAEEAEFQRLRRLPVESLVAIEERVALTATDAARLQNRLADGLAGLTSDPAVARRIAELLLPALRAGLEPDPRLREKRVSPLYAALAEAAERAAALGPVEAPRPSLSAGPSNTVTLDDLLAAAPPRTVEAPPRPITSASSEPDSEVRKRMPTAAEAVSRFLDHQTQRGERSVGRTRLVLLAFAVVSELLEHEPGQWAHADPVVWGTTLAALFGAVVTGALLRVPPARMSPLRVAWISVALDPLLVVLMSLPGAMAPPVGYPGLAHLPSFAIFTIAILASSLRLSRPLVRFSVACNAIGGAALLALDAWVGAAVLPVTPRELVLWVTLYLGASFVADAIAVRTRRMVQEGAGSAVQAERARQALGVYVSAAVAEEAMAADALSPGGRRQAVAVLSCGLVGFSAYAERVAPERLLAELNAFLGTMVAAVTHDGGVVDRFESDGLLVVFGVPKPAVDATSRAVNAAARMSAALVEHNARRAADGLPPLRMTIGVHAGEAVVGNVGTSDRLAFTVVGDVVNLALALRDAARGHGVGVFVSDVAARSIGVLPGPTQLVASGSMTVGGRHDAIGVWTLVG